MAKLSRNALFVMGIAASDERGRIEYLGSVAGMASWVRKMRHLSDQGLFREEPPYAFVITEAGRRALIGERG